MRKTIIFVILSLTLMICSCSTVLENTDSSSGPSICNSNPAEVTLLTAKEAKERLDADESIVIVDVRTPEEFAERHIPNAILLPVDTISENAASVIPDKNKTYLIYCRSGNRSATAAKMLVQMCYTSIYDFGGINDWPYETASGK